jgi:hypothetical protein
MRSKAGMTNRQRNVDLRFAQVSALSTLAWLGSDFGFVIYPAEGGMRRKVNKTYNSFENIEC